MPSPRDRTAVLLPSPSSLDEAAAPVHRLAWLAVVATLAAEAGAWVFDVHPYVGRIPLLLSFPPGVVLLIMCRRLVWDGGERLRAVTALLSGLCVLGVYWYTFQVGNPIEALALVQVGFAEEILFRLALPAALVALFAWAGVRARVGWPLAWFASAVAFALMPGHMAQVSSLVEVLPFVAFSVMVTMVFWRTGNLVAIALWHATFDLLTVPVHLVDASLQIRQFGMLAAAVLMIGGAYWASVERHPAAPAVVVSSVRRG